MKFYAILYFQKTQTLGIRTGIKKGVTNMKKSLIKKSLMWILSALAFISLSCFTFFTVGKPLTARASAWQEGEFVVEDGVSLKYGQEMANGGGMRFIIKMGKSVYDALLEDENAVFGVVIAPKQLMLDANGDYLNMPKKVGGVIGKERIYQLEGADENYYFANACITNIKVANLERDFVAVAYIQNGNEVRYTDYNDDARGDLYDLVNRAMLGGYAEEIALSTVKGGDSAYLQVAENNGWYGSTEYPIVVETDEEVNTIETIAASQDLSYCNVVLKDTVTQAPSLDGVEDPTVVFEDVYEINQLIVGLPDSLTMPEGIGVIGRIRQVEKLYNALSDVKKNSVENYAKLEGLLSAIEGYDRVYSHGANDGTVIPSYVPNYTSTIGGTATTYQDDVYGNVLKVTSDEGGKAALNITNFPNVRDYTTIYFYVRGIGVATESEPGSNVYWSDGITNDGWGANEKNNWSNAFWTNEANFRLVEINVADGYIGTEFALGFRTNNTDFTFEISDFYGIKAPHVETTLTFGTQTDTGETNENGKVYNISREQWYIDNNNTNTIGTLQTNKLANALPSGKEYFYFWMYNGTGTEYNFHLAGDVSGTWTDSKDSTALKVGEWTKVTISAEDIESNKNGQWYVYILGGDGQGAEKDGWKISPIYAGPAAEKGYIDHADVKNVIALINALPQTITLSDKSAIEDVRLAYDSLIDVQKSSVTNLSQLESAEATIIDIESANVVISLIDDITSVDDTALIENARTGYDALSDSAKTYVTNYQILLDYEEEIATANALISAVNSLNSTIASLPDSVVMPDNLVFVSRIEKARDDYDALPDEGKNMVENYAKLRSLLSNIKGYTTVYRQSVDGVNVIPSHVPNNTSTIGGTATMGYDAYYGDYLIATPSSGGKVSIQFKNFPDVSKYAKIYFNIRVVGASCDIYLSDGITNDGWGDDWHNTWSMDGFWTNDGNWIQKEIAVSTGIFTSNWALGLKKNDTDAMNVSFEITDIVAWAPDLGTNSGLTFGNFSDSGTTNAYGTVYNFTQGWSSDTDMGAFNQNALSNALASGHDALHFWIYNPNDSAVDFKFTGDMNSWNPQGEYVTNLPSKVWTEVIVTPSIVEEGKSGNWFINVTTGAGTSGWQISPIYSYSSVSASEDAITSVQNRIDALTLSDSQEKVDEARKAFEALNEKEKDLITITNLIDCETALYGDVANAPFVQNSATEYKIYIGKSNASMRTAIKTAINFFNTYSSAKTGVTLTVIDSNPTVNLTKYSYAIVFGYDGAFAKVGATLADQATISTSGYQIVRSGRAVVVNAYGAGGYQLATIRLLQEIVGYEMIAEDCVLYSKDGSTLPAMNITANPSYAVRQQQTYMTDDEVYGMGLQAHTDIWVPSAEGWDMHNVLHYLPTATYAGSHPNWYTSDQTQICPTAGGTASEFNLMVETIATGMIAQLDKYPARENISFSIMDSAGGDDCTCTRCKLYDTLYGEGGFSAAWIDLMNAINVHIQEYATANSRTVNLAFLAYRSTETAPADGSVGSITLKKRYDINDNGTYTLTDDDLKCDKGVTVWLAPINAKYAENFNHSDNANDKLTVAKWCALSDSVYVWLYGTNFKNYMYPYNSWQASAENYQILKELGVDGVWSQSNETEATAFTDLKAYIDSKFMVDVNADYESVLNSYFTNYFGPASATMRSMFNEIVAKCEEIESNYSGLGRGIYDEIENVTGFIGIGAKTYWSKDWLDGLVSLCDTAKAEVNASSLTDEQKSAIISRITKESLFPRYVLCTTFASKYSSSAKKTLRQEFKADATALGFTLYREANGLLSDLYSEWNV